MRVLMCFRNLKLSENDYGQTWRYSGQIWAYDRVWPMGRTEEQIESLKLAIVDAKRLKRELQQNVKQLEALINANVKKKTKRNDAPYPNNCTRPDKPAPRFEWL